MSFFPSAPVQAEQDVVGYVFEYVNVHWATLSVASLPGRCFHSFLPLSVFLIFFTELDENLDRCVDILTSYINKLRMFMIKFPHKPSSVISFTCDLEEDVPCVEQSQKWEKFNTEVTGASVSTTPEHILSKTLCLFAKQFHYPKEKLVIQSHVYGRIQP